MIDPGRGIDEVRDVVLSGGMIKCVGSTGSPDLAGRGEEYERVIDATDLMMASGLVDVHTHSRNPGLTYKEDIGIGAKTVAAGEFITVVCMVNTKPPADNVGTLSYVIEERKKTDIHVLADATIPMGMKGRELTSMAALKAVGAVGFTDDGTPMMSGQLVLEAMEEVARFDAPLSFREEDPAFTRDNGINHEAVSERTGTYGSPSVVEDALVARNCMIILYIKVSVNIQHMGSHHAVGVIGHTKAIGASVVAEVTPHYFTLTGEAVLEYGTLAKMNPPLYTEGDRQAPTQGLKDGIIDIIAAGHASYSQEEKAKPLARVPSSIIRLETALALGITELVVKDYLTILELVKKMNLNPARLHRLPCGRLQEGVTAGLVIFDGKEL